jgi:hypothetical protein
MTAQPRLGADRCFDGQGHDDRRDVFVSTLAWASGSLWFVDDLNKVLVRVAPAVLTSDWRR